MKKRLLQGVLIFAALTLLVACGARKNPKDTSLLFFKNMRSGKYEDAAACVSGDFDAQRVEKEFSSLGGKFLDAMRDFEYEVTNVEESDTSATVSMKVSYYNLKPIYEEVMKNLLTDVKTNETIRAMDEEALTKEAMMRLNKRVEEGTDLQKVEKSFNLVAKKVEKSWVLELNADVKEVVSGNLSNLSPTI